MRDIRENALMSKLSTMTNEEILDLIGTVLGIPMGIYFSITEIPGYTLNSPVSRVFMEIATPLLSSALFSFMFSRLGKTIDFFTSKRTLFSFWYTRRIEQFEDHDRLLSPSQHNLRTRTEIGRITLKHGDRSSTSHEFFVDNSRKSCDGLEIVIQGDNEEEANSSEGNIIIYRTGSMKSLRSSTDSKEKDDEENLFVDKNIDGRATIRPGYQSL